MEPISQRNSSAAENIDSFPYFLPTSPVFGINQDQLSQLPQIGRPLPQTATASIFAPRTEDMNTGFLTYSEDQPGLTSKSLESFQNRPTKFLIISIKEKIQLITEHY